VTEATHGTGDEQLAAVGHEASITAGQALLSGLRQPLVAILLLIALCSAITGKPLDGFLMAVVATLLVWDAARSRLSHPGGAAYSSAPGYTAVSGSQGRAYGAGRRRRVLAGIAGLATAGLYASVVGSFSRFSWPATIAVVTVGCLMIAIGWQGPLRRREPLTGRPRRRAWLWGVLLIAGGTSELSSLLQQPHLTTDSYAHPTISALTDPLLASHPGRSVALAGWLLIGSFVVGR